MLEVMEKYHKLAEERVDLGSCAQMIVDIQGNQARVSQSKGFSFNKLIDIKDLGKEISEMILLSTTTSKCMWGSWLNEKNLPEYKNVLSFTQEDFEVDLDLMKLWTIARIICNSKREDNTLYHLEWSEDCGLFFTEEFHSKEELEQWFNDYVYVEEE